MFQRLPGFRDFYPDDCAKRNYIFSKWRNAAHVFGFREYDAPVLESLELLEAKSGPEIVSQLFCFEDKGGRRVTLRPELTPSLARMTGAHAGSLKRPIKWFNVGENFRYEKQQKGRLRSFYQFNADILGEPGVSADAEIIALLIHTLCSFGLTDKEFTLRLSDRNLWFHFLESEHLNEEQTRGVLSAIDKLDSEPEIKTLEKLNAHAGEKAAELLAKIKQLIQIRDIDSLQQLLSTNGEAVAGRIRHFRELLSRLKAFGLESFITLDLGVVRGLAYYTGFVFEAFQTIGTGRALAGGGRFDNLVEKLSGSELHAVGFAIGDVTLTDLLELTGKLPPLLRTIDCYLAIANEEVYPLALKDAQLIRAAGLSAEYPFKPSAFGKQFKNADQAGARTVVIYGEDELSRGCVKIRDMANGQEMECPREYLVAELLERLR